MLEEEKIIERSVEFARKNKKRIAREFTDKSTYPPDRAPVSVFMAGSPGAGKTEFSKRILEILEKDGKRVVRIDPDDFRGHFSDYTGTNSYLFQAGVSILVDKVQDMVLQSKQNFIFDSTLSDFEKAQYNIQRSIDKSRDVEIFFVYQKPELAWEFTQKREREEGRRIPEDAFIDHFLNSQKTVNSLKEFFADKIHLNMVIKDIDNSDLLIEENIDTIDTYLPETYTRSSLHELII